MATVTDTSLRVLGSVRGGRPVGDYDLHEGEVADRESSAASAVAGALRRSRRSEPSGQRISRPRLG